MNESAFEAMLPYQHHKEFKARVLEIVRLLMEPTTTTVLQVGEQLHQSMNMIIEQNFQQGRKPELIGSKFLYLASWQQCLRLQNPDAIPNFPLADELKAELADQTSLLGRRAISMEYKAYHDRHTPDMLQGATDQEKKHASTPGRIDTNVPRKTKTSVTANKSPLISQSTAFRLHEERTRKRKLDDSEGRQMSVEAPTASLELLHHFQYQAPYDEDGQAQSSNLIGLDQGNADINTYAIIDPVAGTYAFKILASDGPSLEALCQKVKALSCQHNGQPATVTLDMRTLEMDQNLSEAMAAAIQPEQDFKCCNCGKLGHTVRICAVPQPKTSPRSSVGHWGTIRACPQCNVKTHSVDDCPVIKAELAKMSPTARVYHLGEMLCWGRFNRPAIQSEKWFFLDLLEQWRNSGNMTDAELTEPIANHVPWTESFSQAMANPKNPARPDRPMYPIHHNQDVGHDLPKDPFWEGLTVADALEMHKAGAFGQLRAGSSEEPASRNKTVKDEFGDESDIVVG